MKFPICPECKVEHCKHTKIVDAGLAAWFKANVEKPPKSFALLLGHIAYPEIFGPITVIPGPILFSKPEPFESFPDMKTYEAAKVSLMPGLVTEGLKDLAALLKRLEWFGACSHRDEREALVERN